jgi:general L-amino acid transport system substrate-binding protein
MHKWVFLFALLISLILTAVITVACTASELTIAKPTDHPGNTLTTVLNRGSLICGVNGQLPGFSFADSRGDYSGIDADYCRAIAAALFDDPRKVEFRSLSAQERFTALTTGEVDVLIRNTTWTMNRDAVLGLEFLPPIFYDGQGMMVTAASGVKDIRQLNNATICVQSGTTTEQNLTDRFRQLNVPFTPVILSDSDTLYTAFVQGRCQAVTSDRSQLTIQRQKLASPDSYVILDQVISKEPLAPVVRDQDSKWANALKWIIYGSFQAEELGIAQANLSQFTTSPDPEVKRLLGKEGTLGSDVGLPTNDFVARLIRAVGNYGDIYERNLGKPFKLARGLNNLWTKGGLIYSPPFR